MKYTTRNWSKVSSKHPRGATMFGSSSEARQISAQVRSRSEQWWILRQVIEKFPNQLRDEFVPLMEAFARNQEQDTIEKLREEFLAVAKARVPSELIDAAIKNAEDMITLGFRV